MRYYPSEFIEYLRQTVDLAAIASQIPSIQLRRVGGQYIGHCPFHEDKNPSFMIKSETNTFHCFACKAGSKRHSTIQHSDVFAFVQHAFHLNFSEAVEWVARFANVPLPDLSPEEKIKLERKEQWHRLCEEAAEHYHQLLLNNKMAMDYLKERNFDYRDIKRFKLGYGDNTYPEFANVNERIVFPICDRTGNIISFTGRTLLKPHELEMINQKRKQEGKPPIPKYLDRYPVKDPDPDHPYPVFQKSEYLYGYHLARDYIRQRGIAIIVEGWTDVIKLHKYGFENSVGTMSASLSEAQAQLIYQTGARKTIIMRDGDEAGYGSILKDAEVLMKNSIIPYVVLLPQGYDPDSFCDQFGYRLAEYIDKEMKTINQYKLFRVMEPIEREIQYHESRITLLKTERMKSIIQVLSEIENSLELETYAGQVARILCLSKENLINEVKYYRQSKLSKIS